MFNLTKRDQDKNDALPIRSLQRQIDSLFDGFFDDSLPSTSGLGRTFQPRVNISEDEKFYYIEAELAGVKKEDVKVHYDENNTLSISAKKGEEHKEDKRNYHRVECFSGSFYRSFQLMENIDRDNIKAQMKEGILTITLQKTAKPNSQSKEIEIS